MKIIHTADWHVSPRSRANIEPAINKFVEIVREVKPDLVVHAGDVFDTRGRIDPTSIWIVKTGAEEVARVCPMIFVPGNHDVANAWGEVDSVQAVLGGLQDVTVASAPTLFSDIGGAVVAAVPFPSKYHLAAAGIEADIVQLLGDVIRGLEVEASAKSGPKVLIFHGAIAGGQFDNEKMIGVGQDIPIPRDFISPSWDLVLAGHLHRRQKVGPVQYPGSLTQLSFAQAGYRPTVLVFDTEDHKLDGLVDVLPIPVAQPYISIKVDATKETAPEHLAAAVHQATFPFVDDLDAADKNSSGARARMKVKAPTEMFSEWPNIEKHLREVWTNTDWKFVLEKIPPVRLRSKVTVDTPVEDLLGDWVRLNPHLGPLEARIRAISGQVEQSVGGASETERGASYKPLYTRLDNFKVFGKAEIDWTELPRLTCIKGPNAAGKSTAARAEAFALYGQKALGGSPLRRAVLEGQRDAAVTHTFRAGSDIYRIIRKVKLTAKGTLAGGDVSLAVQDLDAATAEDHWRSRNGADARETQKKINALVGSPDMFFSTRFARQGEIAKLLGATGAERKALLQAALQAGRFWDLETTARHIVTEKRKTADNLRGALEVNLDVIEALPNAKAALDRAGDASRELDEKMGEHNIIRRSAKSDLEAQIKTDSDLRAAGRRKAQIAVEKARIEDNLREMVGEKAELEELLVNAEDLAEKIDRLDELSQDERRLIMLENEYAKIDRDITAVVDKIAGAERARVHQIEALRNDVAVSGKKTAILGSVPCQTFDDPDDYKHALDDANLEWPNFKGCQFLIDAVEAKAEIPKTEAAIEALKKDKSHLEEHVSRKAALEEILDSLGRDPEKLEEIQKEIRGLQAEKLHGKANAIAGAQGKLDAIKASHFTSSSDLERLVLEDSGMDLDLDVVAASNKRIIDLRSLVTSTEEALEAAIDAQKEIARQAGELEANVKTIEAKVKTVGTAERELAELELDIGAGEAYVSAVGRDGIPFLILERALPQIQETMNGLLDGSGLSVVIDPIRDLESGAARDDVNIYFRDGMGEQVLEDASGFQSKPLGVALRAAIALLQAERAGFRPETFTIDEGFGAFDPDNLPYGREMLHRLADLFGQIVYITHVPEIQEAAEAEIVVTPSPTGSTLEIKK